MGIEAFTRIPCVVQVASITPPQWLNITPPLTPGESTPGLATSPRPAGASSATCARCRSSSLPPESSWANNRQVVAR